MDDFVVQVRQIVQYGNKPVVAPTDLVLLQESDQSSSAAGAYRNSSVEQLLSSVLKEITLPEIDANKMTLIGQPVATQSSVDAQLNGLVRSFMGRIGDIFLQEIDILQAGGAPQNNPNFSGHCTAPTPVDVRQNDSTIATTQWVQQVLWWFKEWWVRPPQTSIITAGTYTALTSDTVLLVNVNGHVEIDLPPVLDWIKFQLFHSLHQEIVIKDLGGFAGAFPIVVVAAPNEGFDIQFGSISLTTAFQSVIIRPLDDLTGWYIAGGSGAAGGGAPPGGALLTEAGGDVLTEASGRILL